MSKTKQTPETENPSQDPTQVNPEQPQVDPDQPQAAEQDGEAGNVIEVRVLTLCQLGVANDVVEVPKAAVEGLKSLGYVDDHPEAVAFAKSLKEPKA